MFRQESGARLVFSNKGDFFPETMLRVLGAGPLAEFLQVAREREREREQ